MPPGNPQGYQQPLEYEQLPDGSYAPAAARGMNWQEAAAAGRGVAGPNSPPGQPGVRAAGGGNGSYANLPQYQLDQPARNLMNQTLEGDFLEEGNPYMQRVIDAMNRDTMGSFEDQLGQLSGASLRPGQMGSSIWASRRDNLGDAVAQRIADQTGQLRFQNYGQERGFQNDALNQELQRLGMASGDLTARRGQDTQRDIAAQQAAASRAASSSASSSARYSTDAQARAQEAQIRANLLLGQGGLAEEGRQFDATQAGGDLDWARLLSGQLNAYSGQDQQEMGLLAGMMGQQQGGMQDAAGLGANLGLGSAGLDQAALGQMLQAAGMIPGFEQAGNQGMGMAGDYLANLFSTQGGIDSSRIGANASRYNANLANQQFNDQMNYNSALNQWGYTDPGAALNDFWGSVGAGGAFAGNTTTGFNPGQLLPPGQNDLLNILQGGLGGLGALGGLGGGGGGGGDGGGNFNFADFFGGGPPRIDDGGGVYGGIQ